MNKEILLICEGPTDAHVIREIALHFSNNVTLIAPQIDATSGTYERHGYGRVLNWCKANKASQIQKLLSFKGKNAIFLIHLDTDIANSIYNGRNTGLNARQRCEHRLNNELGTTSPPTNTYYILPTQNIETWILASFNLSVVDNNRTRVTNYEVISKKDVAQILADAGFVKNVKKYPVYGKQIVSNLVKSSGLCKELAYLCTLM
ncbi:MAG: hypothetical protein ACYCUY_02710 [Acidithiobacillus sp.]